MIVTWLYYKQQPHAYSCCSVQTEYNKSLMMKTLADHSGLHLKWKITIILTCVFRQKPQVKRRSVNWNFQNKISYVSSQKQVSETTCPWWLIDLVHGCRSYFSQLLRWKCHDSGVSANFSLSFNNLFWIWVDLIMKKKLHFSFLTSTYLAIWQSRGSRHAAKLASHWLDNIGSSSSSWILISLALALSRTRIHSHTLNTKSVCENDKFGVWKQMRRCFQIVKISSIMLFAWRFKPLKNRGDNISPQFLFRPN